MRIKRMVLSVVAVSATVMFFLTIVAEVMAFGPGGGRGGGPRGGPRGGHRMGRMHHHRMGPARGGSFASRRPPSSGRSSYRTHTRGAPRPTPARPQRVIPSPQPPAPIPPEASPGERQQMQEQLGERRDEMREARERRREKIHDEHWDEYRYRRYREELGTTYTSDYWDDDYCEASVVVNGVTYYDCDGVWYRQAYAGGEVTYVVVEGPRSD